MTARIATSSKLLGPPPSLRGQFVRRVARYGPIAPSIDRLAFFAPLITLVTLLLAVPGAQADPDYGPNPLYGLDPIIRATDDPRLLGSERLVMRQRLLDQGVDPLKVRGGPDLGTAMRQYFRESSRENLEREITDFRIFIRQWQEIKIKEIEIVQNDFLQGHDIAMDILQAIEFIAINDGYTIVLDANDISVIWLSQEIDITDLIIRRLRIRAR